MREHRGAAEPGLVELLAHVSPCDLVLVEGFKRDPMPKLEVHRAANGKPLLFPDDPDIVAIATDRDDVAAMPGAPMRFELDDVDAIAAFVVARVDLP